MSHTARKEIKRVYRHNRIRKKVRGTAERPRICIHRSLNNFHAQLIDDGAGVVLMGKSTLDKALKSKLKSCGNIDAATQLGAALATEAQGKGFKKVVFDRGGYLYHGRVKAFAEALRKGGMEF